MHLLSSRVITLVVLGACSLLGSLTSAKLAHAQDFREPMEGAGALPGVCQWQYSCDPNSDSGYATLYCFNDTYWVEVERELIRCGGERRLGHETPHGESEIGAGLEISCNPSGGSIGVTVGADFLQRCASDAQTCSVPLNDGSGQLSCWPSAVAGGYFVCGVVIDIEGITVSFSFHVQGSGGTYTHQGGFACRWPQIQLPRTRLRMIIDCPRDPLNPNLSDPYYCGHVGIGRVW